LGALARLAQQLLDDVVVALRPVPGLAQPPAVDNVADQIEVFGVGELEEVEQRVGAAAAGAEMDVGDPDRAEAGHRGRGIHRTKRLGLWKACITRDYYQVSN